MSGPESRDRVVVAGAGSQVGVFLLPRLHRAGFGILALSRRAPASPRQVAEGLRWLRPDAEELNAGPGQPPRHLVSCGPLRLAIDLLRRLPPVQRVVAFSTSSVVGKASTRDAGERARIAAIAGDEIVLREACRTQRTSLLLLRPTLIYGCGLDRNLSLLARWGRRTGFLPLAGEACGLRQPVHADDLAALAVAALLARRPVALESMACGGSTLTYRQMVAKVAAANDGRIHLLGLPEWVMVALTRVAKLFPTFRELNVEMVRRQNRNLVFDDSDLRTALLWRPRRFEPTAKDFEVPAAARELQLPGG